MHCSLSRKKGEWYLPVRKGLHPALSTAQFLSRFFPEGVLAPHDAPKAWVPLLTPPRTGESMHDVHRRAREFVDRLTSAVDPTSVETVIVFSHAATCIAISRALAGDLEVLYHPETSDPDDARRSSVDRKLEWREDERLECRAATCSVSKFQRREESAGGDERVETRRRRPTWDRVWNGRTDFLPGGEERHWEFSFVEVGFSKKPRIRSFVSGGGGGIVEWLTASTLVQEYEEDGLLEDGTEAGKVASDNYKGLPTDDGASSSAAAASTMTAGKL